MECCWYCYDQMLLVKITRHLGHAMGGAEGYCEQENISFVKVLNRHVLA